MNRHAQTDPPNVLLDSRWFPAALVVCALVAIVYVVLSMRSKNPRAEAPTPEEVAAIEASELDGDGDVRPRLLRGEQPGTPNVDIPLAPTIVCRILIDESGRVAQARVFRSRFELALFEEEALKAVREYEFEPARRDGIAVASWINWPITFYGDVPPPERHIQVKGSDTIGGALGPALAMAYHAIHPAIEVRVEALGSSTAFGGLFDGSADIGMSSRPINASELAEATRLGIHLEEFNLGYDGIAVVVHEENPIDTLTLEQVGALFRGDIESWDELGWHARPVHPISRPDYSGTQDIFRTKVLSAGARTASTGFSSATRFVESSETISTMVADDEQAIAYLGLPWVGPGVKIVALASAPQDPAAKPDDRAIRQGEYPLVRPLLAYTRGIPSPEVADFLRFVVSPAGRAIIGDNGFVAPEGSVPIPSHQVSGDAAVPQVERVYFAADRVELDAAALEVVERVANTLLTRPDQVALVIGNVDAGGGQAENLETSYARGTSVARALEVRGIASDRITVEAADAQRPISTNLTAAGRSANRRVDVFVTPRPAEVPENEGKTEEGGTQVALQSGR